jgi:hypothetical protein
MSASRACPSRLRTASRQSGLAAATFIHPGTGDPDALEVSIDEHNAPRPALPGPATG